MEALTLGDITVTDSLSLAGAKVDPTTANIEIAASATSTTIDLQGGTEDDSFKITTGDYASDATLRVSGNLGTGGDDITVDASAEGGDALTIDLGGLDNVTTGKITGGKGADKLYGSTGDDTINIDGNDTVVDGNAGADTVILSAAADFTDDGDVFTEVETIDMSASGANLTLFASQLDGVNKY